METMESVEEAVRVWRRAHRGRRGPLPMELRRRIAALAGRVGSEAVRARLDIGANLLACWQERYAPDVLGLTRRAAHTFVEVRPEAVPVPRPCGGGGEFRVEVTAPGGCVVRIQGAMEPHVLSAVIRAVVSPGRGG
jgi:hypothetical protein